MNDLIVNEIKKNHNEAEQYIYLFLVGIDAVTFIGAIIFFGFEIENFDSPRHKLFTILFLDIFVEIISIFTDAYMNNLLQETVFTLILAIQFYLYLQIIERVFSEFIYKYLFSFIYFLIVFDIKMIFPNNKLFCVIQYISAIFLIYFLYKRMMTKLDNFMNNVLKINIYYQGGIFAFNLPFFILVYLIIFYVFKLIELLIESELYKSYIIMICLVFKEVSKYLIIFHLFIILYAYNKYIKNSGVAYTIEQNKNLNKNKKKNNDIKDEEKMDIKQEEK
jgi:hypothetical protein